MDKETREQIERIKKGIEYRKCECGEKFLAKIRGNVRKCLKCSKKKPKNRRILTYKDKEYEYMEFFEKFKHRNPTLTKSAFMGRMGRGWGPERAIMERLYTGKKLKNFIDYEGKKWTYLEFYENFKNLSNWDINYKTFCTRMRLGADPMEAIVTEIQRRGRGAKWNSAV